ncbi:hypothetical protein SC409_05080 [Legionella pneumophila serogroup 1]
MVDTIKKDGGYTGARVELFGELAKAKIKIQIDIGFGDAEFLYATGAAQCH